MNLSQVFALVAAVTITVYWGCVVAMAIKVRRRARGLRRVFVPAQRREQWMWLVWTPLVLTWIGLPWIAAFRPQAAVLRYGLPADLSEAGALHWVKAAAVIVAALCLAGSIACWRRMGKHWRMGIDPAQEVRLIDDGLFAYVRHPIYALSMLLMLCTAVVVLALLMWAIAAIHVVLMNLKAAGEERFLLDRLGPAYAQYVARTGRFVPRVRGASTARGAGSGA